MQFLQLNEWTHGYHTPPLKLQSSDECIDIYCKFTYYFLFLNALLKAISRLNLNVWSLWGTS